MKRVMPFVSNRWLLKNMLGFTDGEIDMAEEGLRGLVVPVIRLSQDECVELEKDWDVRALNAGLEPAVVTSLGVRVSSGTILEEGTVLAGADQLRALYRAASRKPRVEPVLRRIEATGISVVDMLGGLG